MSRQVQEFYEFGDFQFDPEKRVLWRGSDIVSLPPKALDVLFHLLVEHGDLVEREILIERVWSDTFVEEGNLNHAVSALRRAIGNDAIQTVPRRGYRFTADLSRNDITDEAVFIEKRTSSTALIEESEVIVDDVPTQESQITRSATGISGRPFAILGAAAFILVGVAASAWFLLTPVAGNMSAERTPIKSLAVLPLRSFSRDATDEELRLRITDALITKLGRLDDLAVRPTTSVLRFVGEEQDALAAGRTLGVDAVLDGRVQEENGRLRVTLQLVSVISGDQLWADQFDGRAGETLRLQDAISQKLLAALDRRGGELELKGITLSNEAYEAYLKGRYFWNQRTPDAYSKAINYFQEAVRLDPDFALAYSGLADSYVLFNRRLDGDPATLAARAEDTAQRGLELDETLAETHTSMAVVLSAYRRDWEKSNQHFQRAIELNPRYAIAHAWYGLNLISLGRFAEARDHLAHAQRLDPTSRNIAVYTIVNYYYSRRFDEAIERGKAAIELDPQLSTAYMYLSYAYEQKGAYKDAVEAELARSKSVLPGAVEELRTAYERAGIRGFWRKQIEVKNRQSEQGVNCEQEIATRYSLLGATEKALEVIEKNFRFGGTCWNGIAYEPAFDALRAHPRFQAVTREMGFE